MNKPKCPNCGHAKWIKPSWALKNQQRQCKKCGFIYFKDKINGGK